MYSVKRIIFGCFLASLLLLPQTRPATADVCSEGTGIPPFLSSATDPNLLLVLDNSGSMLDPAYVDTDNQCFDETFNSATTYSGNYDSNSWYKWTFGLYSPWYTNTAYSVGDRVYVNGIIYEATAAGTSVGDVIGEDSVCDWQKLYSIDTWENNTTYNAGDFVEYDEQLYYTDSACTSSDGDNSDGINIDGDTACTWEKADYTWRDNTTYNAGDIVTYNGEYYETATGGTSNGASVHLDTGVTWTRLNEGYFEVDDTTNSTTSSDYCSGASGTTHSNDDLCVTYNTSSTPESITAFAATGNFLNWATASKFDVEKEILTGGKYDQVTELVESENRGCAGRGFIKQVALDNQSADVSDDKVLTMTVRGPRIDGKDWVDTTDDTTRIEINGITDDGFDNTDCQLAIDEMQKEVPNQGQLSGYIDGCLEYENINNIQAASNAVFNHAVHFCWTYAKTGDWPNGSGSVTSTENGCAAIYENFGVAPSSIVTEDSGYACYGVYDAATEDDLREGYVGRCWEEETFPEDCVAKECDAVSPTVEPQSDENPYHDPYCSNDKIYYCDGSFNQNKGTCGGSPGEWKIVLIDNNDSDLVTCDVNGATTPAQWTDDQADDPDGCVEQAMKDYCGQLTIPEVIDPSDQATESDEFWNLPAVLLDSGKVNQLGGADPLIIMKGYYKYELPSEQLSDADERPDGPRGVLYEVASDIRLGVMAFNDNGSATECNNFDTVCTKNTDPDLYDVCNPAADPAGDPDSDTCDYCKLGEAIDRYCPDDNQDGGRVVANIGIGMYDDDNGTPGDTTDDFEVWSHYKTIVNGINNTRATSWTPLAEAYYNALGYYGQKTSRRLNSNDFKVQSESGSFAAAVADQIYDPGEIVSYNGKYYQAAAQGTFPTWLESWLNNAPASMTSNLNSWLNNPDDLWTATLEAFLGWSEVDITRLDPVQYYCQDNHVLLITEGASTTDVNSDVITLATGTGADTGDTDSDATCSDGLQGSTYLDDLVYFGHHGAASDIYDVPQLPVGDPDAQDKQNITTHIVMNGTERTDGTGECSPSTLLANAAANSETSVYPSTDPGSLEQNLLDAFSDILSRASAGSAASVISSSRTGEGAVYQAVFWPEVSRGVSEDELTWIGDVHAVYVDDNGYMWDDYSGGTASSENQAHQFWTEDTNGNGYLDAGENVAGLDDTCLDGDRRVFFYYDGSDTQIYHDENYTGSDYCNSNSEPTLIKDFDQYLWSVNTSLRELDDVNILVNRSLKSDGSGRWDWSGSRKRYIFTWNDLDNDGIVDYSSPNEIIAVDDSTSWVDLDTTHGYTHNILDDFNIGDEDGDSDIDNTDMTYFVHWLRGVDEWYEPNVGAGTTDINGNGKLDYVYRCRRQNCIDPSDAAAKAANPEWRVGDVIHSTPKLAAQPAEAYHTIYRDPTYAYFVKRYRHRRHMIYFGANDGMLHAVNGGFFDDDNTRFWRNMTLTSSGQDAGTVTYDDSEGPMLGDEMWAYIPYNLQPHLKCLADPDYDHKYFVDLEPRLFDVQIFEEEAACSSGGYYDSGCVHPKGWGTIVVGGMRFGGTPTDADSIASDHREFMSSYFILDITDPERPPTLLGEITTTDETYDWSDGNGTVDKYIGLGYTTSVPSGIVMRDSDGHTTWYLVFGNGPTTLDAENSLQGRLAILPLAWLNGDMNWATLTPDSSTRRAIRIPNTDPVAATNYGGRLLVPAYGGVAESFISSMSTVDYELTNTVNDANGARYKSDALYFGTTDGTGFTTDVSEPDKPYWGGGGRLFRLVTRQDTDSDGVQDVSTPDQWYVSMLLDALAPVPSAPSIATDDNDNFWIYFGTGRFYTTDDKTDEQDQYYFGVREPLDATTCDFTWGTINWLNAGVPKTPDPTQVSGSRGLIRTDRIDVAEFYSGLTYTIPLVFCEDGYSAPECPLTSTGLSTALEIPDALRSYYSYYDFSDYIVGDKCQAGTGTTGIDGWYRKFHETGERNFGQATLLSGLVTFTTYIPSSNICTEEGSSNLYALNYKTGTAWYEDVIGTYTIDSGTDEKTIVKDEISLGHGLATTPSLHSGGAYDAKAFVQTSTGQIVEVNQENLPIEPPETGKTSWSDKCP